MQVMGPDWILNYKQTKVHMWNDYTSTEQKCQVFIKDTRNQVMVFFKSLLGWS